MSRRCLRWSHRLCDIPLDSSHAVQNFLLKRFGCHDPPSGKGQLPAAQGGALQAIHPGPFTTGQKNVEQGVALLRVQWAGVDNGIASSRAHTGADKHMGINHCTHGERYQKCHHWCEADLVPKPEYRRPHRLQSTHLQGLGSSDGTAGLAERSRFAAFSAVRLCMRNFQSLSYSSHSEKLDIGLSNDEFSEGSE